VLSIAGHGAQEAGAGEGFRAGWNGRTYSCCRDSSRPRGFGERILGKEFNHFIKQFEQHGARVLFIADTCHGGGMARKIDPRGETMSFRQVPSYRLTEDLLKPVTTGPSVHDAILDFERTEFLAAVDRKTKSAGGFDSGS